MGLHLVSRVPLTILCLLIKTLVSLVTLRGNELCLCSVSMHVCALKGMVEMFKGCFGKGYFQGPVDA